MTVSRVARGVGYVSEGVQKRVKAAMEELGYIPNELARGLRSKSTQTLALIISDITNPFFTTVARGAEDAASDAGYLMLFCNTDENADEEQRYVRLLVQKRVDGILLVPATDGAVSLEFAEKHETPVVVLDRAVDYPNVDVVRCDSEGGAFLLARHLAERGHSQFGVLAGPEDVSTSTMRITGFLRGLGDRQAHVLHGRFSRAEGARMTREMMARAPRPTALFAANNFIALGCLAELALLGLRVPQDVAVVGFDDLPDGLVVTPFLTASAQPAYEMGKMGVEQMLKRINQKDTFIATQTVLPTELRIRTSSDFNI
jgi:LacI family transcriptional regulator